MKIAKIYAVAWFMAAVAVGGVYLLGFLSETLLTIYGFVFSTLLFLGVIAVLPALMEERFLRSRRAG
jgi:fatty acid desaturase